MSEAKTTVEKIMQVYRKYHLTPRQNIQVTDIVMNVCNNKRVMILVPMKAGQNTVYRAANEILQIIGEDYSKKLTVNNIKRS